MESHNAGSLGGTLDRLVAQAVACDISPEAAREARRATERVMRRSIAGPLTVAQQRRVEAYFSAVVRRRAVRRGQPVRGAARVVVAAVVADLRESGRDAGEIWEHLERGWRDSVPADVLEEYRLRLCG